MPRVLVQGWGGIYTFLCLPVETGERSALIQPKFPLLCWGWTFFLPLRRSLGREGISLPWG